MLLSCARRIHVGSHCWSDPYHGPDQQRMAFSVNQSMQPPRLFETSCGNGRLIWAFRLSHSVTSRHGHDRCSIDDRVLTGSATRVVIAIWLGAFYRLIIRRLSRTQFFVFFAYGGMTPDNSFIDWRGNEVIGQHPSPLSAHRGFFDLNLFSSVNRLLREQSYRSLMVAALNLSGDRKGHTGQLF